MSEKTKRSSWELLLVFGVLGLLAASLFFVVSLGIQSDLERREAGVIEATEANLDAIDEVSDLEAKQRAAKHASMLFFGIGVPLVGLGIRLRRLALRREA